MERGLLSSLLNNELPGSDDVEEIEASARYFVDQAGLHVHSLFLSSTEGRYTTVVNVASILQKNRLITIREGSIEDLSIITSSSQTRSSK